MNNLASKLREGTKHSHTEAENVAFIKCFIKGVVDLNSFKRMISSLYLVYQALETEMERNQNHPILGKIYFSELNRTASLAKDLEYYYGSNWQQEMSSAATAKMYIDRIRELAATEPALLVGHAYTRYMGDLSGGQAFGRITRSALNLPEGEGAAFYEFKEIPDARDFKMKYRAALESLPIDETMADKIVTEANIAFDFNMTMFEELEGDLIQGLGIERFTELTTQRQKGSTTV